MRTALAALRVLATIAVLLAVTGVILDRIHSGYYIVNPDPAHPVAPLVHVKGHSHPVNTGELYFVDVRIERASELQRFFNWLGFNSESSLVPVKEILPPGSNDKQFQRQGLQEMKFSKQTASVVAERRLGYDVVFKTLRVYAVDPKFHARGILKRGDVILAVNGVPTPTLARLHAAVSTVKPGAVLSLRIRRDSKTQAVHVKTSDRKGVPVIGIGVEPTTLVLPVKVAIDSGDIGGPSAGLAFTLEVMRQLGADVTHGYRVAATGEINLDGTVSAIGGIEQKTYGVRDAGAQVFLVPADRGNAKTAKRFAGPNLKIIPVTSIGQALHALAALPKLK